MSAVFEIYRATTKTIRRQIVDEDGDPVDLTGNTSLKLYVAPDLETASASLTLNKTMTVYGSATNGTVEYQVLPADTTSLTPKDYVYEIEVVIPSGTFVTEKDTFKILPRVKA